jgi:hypothetical protein
MLAQPSWRASAQCHTGSSVSTEDPAVRAFLIGKAGLGGDPGVT